MKKQPERTPPRDPRDNIQRSTLVSIMQVGMRRGIDEVKRAAQDKPAGNARIRKLK